MATAASVVSRLGQFLGEEGIQDGIEALKVSTTSQSAGLASHIDGLAGHLNSVVQSGADFARAPAWYSRPGVPPPLWWLALTTTRLDGMLEDLNVLPPPPDRLRLACTNAANPTSRPQGEPNIVRGQVDLEVASDGAGIIPPPIFTRRQPRRPATILAASSTDPLACIDATPPAHGAAFKYEAAAVGYRSHAIDVIDLESFEVHGIASVPDAERVRIPSRPRGNLTWSQEIVLPRAGTIDLTIYHASTAAHVQVSRTGHAALVQATSATSAYVTALINIEDGNELDVQLLNATGQTIGEWTIHCTVDEPDESATSRFEALVRAHQSDRRPGIARAPGTSVQRLEDQFLLFAESWKPLSACWTEGHRVTLAVDWTEDRPRLGDIYPATDPRPIVLPPPDYLAAREAIRLWLREHGRPVAELDLANADFRLLAEEYITQYRNWLGTSLTWRLGLTASLCTQLNGARKRMLTLRRQSLSQYS